MALPFNFFELKIQMVSIMKIPDGVNVEVRENTVIVKGPEGELTQSFNIKNLKIKKEGDEVVVASPKLSFKNTVSSIIGSMMKGVVESFEQKLVIRYSHFPITLEVKGKEIIIKNFLGERSPRKCKVDGPTKIEVKGKDILVSGPDKRAVGQTVANLRKATKVGKKDERVFEDGIYFPVDHW